MKMNKMTCFGDDIIMFSAKDRRISASSSKGNQTKWERDSIWYKADYLGYEALAEVICSRLLETSTTIPFVRYDLCWATEGDEKFPVCKSSSFILENEEFKTFQRIFEEVRFQENKELEKKSTESKISIVCKVVSEYCGFDVTDYVCDCLLFDCCVLGEDRHYNNLGVIKGEGVFSRAPVFDNGLALLSDEFSVKGSNIAKLVLQPKAKPFSTDFKKQAYAALAHNNKLLVFRPEAVAWDDLREFYPEETIKRAYDTFSIMMEKTEGLVWKR